VKESPTMRLVDRDPPPPSSGGGTIAASWASCLAGP